ncbi:LysM domain/BON superfamily protein [Streptomyces sp. ADI97-07]|uniref:LysM peptidoglycan-binding domain-containing protein n=1 Tax=Streptomyces sp. ADI97-07 TaxID=1522762 RepID=UPI000F550F32|nr:LysM peptidoglycan-binding domain-containing protein [Streptomyces sp. ADI97-07]RPK71496.1 LysM domain/BON superfamily protein [Streptomyces sp. ADI97-07]
MPESPTGLSRRPSRPARRKGAGLWAVLRALTSLVVLAVLLAGLPMLLWWATGVVAPAGIDALGNLLGTQDSGQVFLLVLAAAGWVGWGMFTLSVLVEIPAQLRGRTAPQLRLLVGQRAAATLVGAVLLALPTGTALAASASPAAAAPAVATLAPASTSTQQDTAKQAESDANRQAAHTVADTKPAESLWSIAQDRLGDGNRWVEIAALNDGRTMSDGQTFRADLPIRPGWNLHLPSDARPTDPVAGPDVGDGEEGELRAQGGGKQAATGEEYVVEAGDSLSKIATDELGDESKYPEIFELNKGEAQPDGGHFTNPDHIFPGQNLTLPATAIAPEDGDADEDRHGSNTPSPQTPDDGGQPDDAGQGDVAEEQPLPAPPSAPAPEPSTVPGPAASASPPGAEPSQAEPSAEAAPEASDDNGGGVVQEVALVAGIGALLAASMAGALGVKRILQQRRRRAGETIAIDADPSLLEQIFNTSGEPASAALLDTALRTLAGRADGGVELPVVRGARITGQSVHLLVENKSATPLPPFTGGDEPEVWVLDPAAALLDEAALAEVPAPCPGLVTLGATEDGDLLLVDLMHRVLLLDGEPDDVLAVTRALALEAGTCGWSDHTDIITVGLGSRLAALLPKGRVQTMPMLQSVVADLGSLLLEVHQQDETAPAPLPWILICAGDIDGDQVWQLADALSAARKLPIAVVLPANDATRQAFPAADTIPAAPDTPVELPELAGRPIQLQRLTDEQYRSFIHALEVTEEPAQPATGAWKLSEDHAHIATTPLTVYLDDGAADPGNPFPALLASAAPDQRAETAEEANGSVPATSPGSPTVPAQAVPSAVPPADGTEDEDLKAPEIRILGPLQVSSISSSGNATKVGALAALIHLRPGRSADALCTAMDPVNPWSTRTLQSRLSEIRARFGADADGQPYLPRPKNGYSFRPGIRSDWARFQKLAARGLAAGPSTGIPDLENALGLVRGKPLEGQDYPWADSIQQEVISRVVDVTHTLAAWLTEGDNPDMDAARHAVLRGLDVDETSEVLYRDWMHIEWAAGNTLGVRKVIARLQQVARSYDISLEPLTEQTISLVLSDSHQQATVR